jgi:hypothetical protein
MGRPDGKRSFGRPRRRREDNNKNVLEEMGWRRMNCASR